MDRQSDSNFKIFRPKKVFWLFQATNQFTQQNFFPINAVGITFDVECLILTLKNFKKHMNGGKFSFAQTLKKFF